MTRVRVGIVNRYRLEIDAIQKIIEGEFDVTGTATNSLCGITLGTTNSSDVLLLDIELPALNGLEAAKVIKRQNPQIRIIFVTSKANLDCVREAFEAGASGYVLKQASSAELLTAIRSVYAGQFFLSTLITDRFEQYWSALTNPLKLIPPLTIRERQVLHLVAGGKSEVEIALDLFICLKTVEFHKKNLRRKLKVKSVAELIRYEWEMTLLRTDRGFDHPLTDRVDTPERPMLHETIDSA